MIFFATTAKNIEPLLLDELHSFGISQCKSTHLGVYFQGNLELAYRACLWSRLANTVLLELKTFRAATQENLYGAVRSIDWSQHFGVRQTFRIDVSGRHPTMVHPHFIAHVTKDAIVDQFRRATGERPSIQQDRPDIVLHLHVRDEEFSLYLDLSGESLHRRGLRTETGEAPLKETLASALLIRAGWPKMMNDATTHPMLFDPCCGAGTLLLEGAMMAYDIAPGGFRNYFGFLGWKKHDPALWEKLKAEAKTREAVARKKSTASFLGFDINPKALAAAEYNFQKLDLSSKMMLEKREVGKGISLPDKGGAGWVKGLLITNPPYGKRLMSGETEAITRLYQHLGEGIKACLTGWKIAIFTEDTAPVKALRMRPKKQYQLMNGTLECSLLTFEATPDSYWRDT